MRIPRQIIDSKDAPGMPIFRSPIKGNMWRNGRRRGVAYVYLALGMLIFLGMTGLVVDIGHLHMKEAQAMRAADAAALAGAMKLSEDSGLGTLADKAARDYAEFNGYDPDAPGVTFRASIDPENSNWYTVYIARSEPLFFMRAIPGIGSAREVGATATAEFLSAVPVDIKMGGGVYGAAGPVNLTLYGPHAQYQHGDPYSPRWLDGNGTPNPENIGHKGFDFELFVPSDYSARNENNPVVNVELFDPDTFNGNGQTSPNGTSEWDEIRQPYAGTNPPPASIYTQTRFTLYKVVDPNDPGKDLKISEATYRDDASTNNQWVTPAGFGINTNTYGTGAYRINVESLDGSSENGFDMRAGPPRDSGQAFDKDNGTKITATGRIPINFNTTGTTTIALGEVPTAAAGGDLIIEKFDTDIQSKSVVYTSVPPASNQPPGGWPGVLSENAKWYKDAPIRLPGDYKTAQWYATYIAGWQDTSVWKMSYTNTVAGTPGNVRLVGRNGKPY